MLNSPQHLTVWQVFRITLWFGLVTGLLEVLILFTQEHLFHQIIHRGRDYSWMTPLANMTIFAIFGSLPILVAWRAPRFLPFPGLIFLFSFLAGINLALAFYQTGRTILLAAVGILAVGMARLADSHPAALHRLFTRTLPWLAAVVFLIALGAR